MATLTATTYAKEPRSLPSGMISVSGSFNSGATEISASATTILLCKIPNRATIVDFVEHHTTGAATCPVDYGIDSDLSAIATAVAQGTVNRLNKGANVGYQVSLSDDAAVNYSVLKATATPGTSTASLKINFTVQYSMDR